MSAICLPKTVESAFLKSTDRKKFNQQLAKYLRTETVLNALIDHRKSFAEVNQREYNATLEAVLSFYLPGNAAGINELAKNANKLLNERFEDRRISQTQIKESFIPLLRDVELIVGDGSLSWAYLDTPSALTKFKARTHNMYTAYMAQTEHEAKLKYALRDSTALRKLEEVVNSSRVLQEDIGNQLSFLKREDKKHRELAMELGVPYSQIKEQSMKQQKRSKKLNIAPIAFPAIAISVILFGFIMSSDDNAEPVLTEQAGSVEYYEQPQSIASAQPNPYNLSDGEYEWRQRYIELFKANGGGGSQAMEDELFDLAAIHMISRSQMQVIVDTITAGEVKL